MGDVLQRRAIMVSGRAIPVIAVLGPSGTGKSLLARRLAQVVTRSQATPKVLLVDGDLYNRGLTREIEAMSSLICGCLHDVVVGRNPRVDAMNLRAIRAKSSAWESDAEEGHLLFLGSARRDATNPWQDVAKLAASDLQNIWYEAVGHAASDSAADCVVIDTSPVPEPCAAVLTSLAELIIIVGSKDKTIVALEEYRQRLQELGAPLAQIPAELVFNQVDLTDDDWSVAGARLGFHLVPYLHGVGDEDIDPTAFVSNMALDIHLVALLARLFGGTYPALVPVWYAPLPVELRHVIREVERHPPNLVRRCSFRVGIPVLLSMLGLLWLFLSISHWETFQTPDDPGFVASWVQLALSLGLFAGPAVFLLMVIKETEMLLAFTRGKLDPIVACLVPSFGLGFRQRARRRAERNRKTLLRKRHYFRRFLHYLPQHAEGVWHA